MAGIGTRAGICPGYIPTPNNTCKLCGKREYQHTFEGNDVPIEIVKSKVPINTNETFFKMLNDSIFFANSIHTYYKFLNNLTNIS